MAKTNKKLGQKKRKQNVVTEADLEAIRQMGGMPVERLMLLALQSAVAITDSNLSTMTKAILKLYSSKPRNAHRHHIVIISKKEGAHIVKSIADLRDKVFELNAYVDDILGDTLGEKQEK